MTRTWWVNRLFRARTTPARHPVARPSLLWLEDRTAPATLTEADAGKTLVITLDEASEALTVVSAGTTYGFTTSGTKFQNGGVTSAGDFTGFNTKNLTLEASGLTRYNTVRIVDSAASTKVTFADSGGNSYSDQFQVTLDNGSAGIDFNLSTNFGANPAQLATDATFSVPSGATVAGSGGITIRANAVAIDTSGTPGTLDGTGGRVTVTPFTAANAVHLGGADAAGVLGLTDAELGRIKAAALQAGDPTNTGGVSVTTAVTKHTDFNTLAIVTGGAVSQSAPLSVTNLRVSATGTATLTDAGNNMDTVAISASSVTYTDVDALSTDVVDSVTGLTATGGDVTLTLGANSLLTANKGISATSGNITVNTDRVTLLAAAGFVASNVVTIKPVSAAWAIDLGSSTNVAPSTLELFTVEVGRLKAPTVVIGDAANSGGIVLSDDVAADAGTTNLALRTAGAVTQTATKTITASKLAVSGSSVALDTGSHVVGTVAGSAATGNFAFKSGNPTGLTVGTVGVVVGIQAPAGSITVRSVNDLNATTAQLTASTTIALFVADGNASGHIATVKGAILTAPGGVTITGGTGSDTFNLTASATTDISVVGDLPSPPTLPGDTLHVDGETQKVSVKYQGPNGSKGKVVVAALHPIAFQQIESIQVVNAQSTDTSVDGTAGDDVLVMQKTGSGLVFSLNGGPQMPVLGTKFTFNGLDGNDRMLADFSGGDFALSDGVTFNGDNNTDTLQINGSGLNGNYRPSAVDAGTVTVGTQKITFATAEQVDAFNAGTFSLFFPGADDSLTIANGSDFGSGLIDALRVTSPAAAFAPITLWNNAKVAIDTADAGGIDGNDTVTVTSADNAHANGSLSIRTGSGTDTVTINGAVNVSGSFAVNSVAVTINANITAGTTANLTHTGLLQVGAVIVSGTAGVSESGGGAVTLTGDATARSTGGPVAFSGAIDAAVAGGQSLSILAGTTATLSKSAGQTLRLKSLAVTGPAINMDGSAYKTQLDQTYTGPVTVSTATVLFDSTAGVITFAAGLDGATAGTSAVTATASGAATFSGPVGGSEALASLIATGSTIAVNGGLVNTTGSQTFNSPVTLGQDAVFTSSTSGAIAFNDTLTGGFAATVKTQGTTTFANAVAIGTLTTDAGGTTLVNGGLIQTAGGQLFGDAVTLGVGTLFKTTASGNVRFASTMTGAGKDVIVNTAGTTQFDGAVLVGTLATDGLGLTVLTTTSVTTGGKQLYGDAVRIQTPGNEVATLSSAGGGDVKFASTVDGPGGLVVGTAGTTVFAGPVGSTTPLASVNTGSGGTTQIDGGLVRTVAGQAYGDSVLVTAGTTFTAGTFLFFQQTLSGPVGVVTNSPQVVFQNAVNILALTVNAMAGPVIGVTIAGPAISATNGQSYALPVTLTGDVTFASPSGDVTFAQTLTGGVNVLVASNQTTTFGGPVNLANLTTDSGGATVVRGGSIITSGFQKYLDSVTVAEQNTAFNSSGGQAIVFGSSLTGSVGVTINTAADCQFNGPVNLTFLTTNAGGGAGVNTGLVQTAGDQTFNNAVAVFVPATFRAGGNIGFGSTLNGSVGVTVESPGSTAFNGPVTLGALITDAPGMTVVNGGSIVTSGGQSFNDPVALGADSLFASTGGLNVFFGQSLSGPGRSVTVNTTGTSVFIGPVRLGAIATDAAGTTAIFGGSVVTDGAQVFNDPVAVGAANSFIAGGQVFFGQSLTGPVAVVVNSPGATTFGGSVSLASLATDVAGNTVVNTGLIQTSGGQDFGDTVTANVPTTFAGAAITYRSTLFSGNSVALTSGGDATFFAPVAVGSLTTDAGGRTIVRGGSVDATSGQSYGDDVLITTTSRLATAAGDLSFLSRLDAETDGTLGLNAIAPAGTLLFAGAVGSTGRVATLAADAVMTRFAADFHATNDVSVNARGGGVEQPAGSLTTGNLGLSGIGTFTLDQIGNGHDTGNDIAGTFRANITGPITLADRDDLTVDAAGIVTNNNAVMIRTGKDFTAQDTRSGDRYSTPMVNVGGATFKVDPGHFAPAIVTFDAEIDPAQAVFGLPGGANGFSDEFRIRPSANVQIEVNGNAPGNPLLPGQLPDTLVPLFSGAQVAGFTYDGSNGTYTFNDRQSLSFTGIESLARRALAGFVVQTGEPRDATGAVQVQYAVRIVQTQAQQSVVNGKVVAGAPIPLPGGLDGKALLQNPFVVAPSFVNPSSPNAAPRIAFGDVNGDGAVDLILASGPGTAPLVTVIDGRALNTQADNTLRKLEDLIQQGQVLAQFYAYDPRFLGGVNVTTADLDGDGCAEIIAGAEQGGGPHVRVFNIKKGGDIGFFIYEPTFTGGVRVAAADVNHDGFPDLVFGAGLNGGPRVTIMDGKTLVQAGQRVEIANFFAYDPAFRGGIYVDAGDYDNDGFADILTGPGIGGGSHVRVFSGKTALVGASPVELAGFFAFENTTPDNPLFSPGTPASGVGGVAFSGTSANGSRNIIVGTGRGPQVQVKEFNGNGHTPLESESIELLKDQQFLVQGVNPETRVKNPTILPLPSLLGYGASVGGFADPFSE